MHNETHDMQRVKLSSRNIALSFRARGRKNKGEVVALENVSLDIHDGEFAVIVGPSGCGKSSLLYLAAGLMEPTAGEITLNGRVVHGPAADRGMVFQAYTLFPWLTVQKNVEFGLRLRKTSPEKRAVIAQSYISEIGLGGFESAYPGQLSGGMKQRVAIARAMANDPDILLMDEPFGALDSQTRVVMQHLLLRVWEQTRKTVLFVTHDVDEAILLANRVIIMTARPGRIKEMIRIDLPRPRTGDIVMTEPFLAYKRRILKSLAEEHVDHD